MSRRVPTRLKRLRGTSRRDRTNPREPKPLVRVPLCRRSLPASVRAMYHRLGRILAPLRVVTVADGLALELAASALVEHETAARVILEQGATYQARTEAGAVMHRARPEQAIAADAWRRAASMLQQFGLTPASRTRVESLPEPVGHIDPLEGSRWQKLVP
jgi:P27 family predicted phage terminase small subunit